MTIANQTNRTSAEGAGVALVIPYAFPTTASGDLKVVMREILTGDPTELTEGADPNGYIATYGSVGGTVTTSDSIDSTHQVHVIRNTDMTQTLDLEQGGSFHAENLEKAIDKNTKLIIENSDSLERTLVFPSTDPTSSFADMPNSIDRASKNLTFDANGKPTASTVLEKGEVLYTDIGENIVGAADAESERDILELGTSDDVEFATITGATITGTTGIYDDIKAKSPWIDVTHPDFGAVGNGVANDTAEIQAALDAAHTAGGGIVLFPEGTYLTDQLNIYDNTILTGTGNGSVLKLNDNGAAQNLLLIGDAESYVTIKDLQLNGNNQDYDWHCLVKAYGADYTTVQNCHVTNMGSNSYGIWFAHAAINCMAINNYVDNCENGITLASNGTLIRGNIVVNCALIGINVESSSPSGGNIGVIVSNNYINGNAITDFGMRFGGGEYAGNHIQIIDNTIFDCVITGISSRSSDDWDYEYITIRGNICNGNGTYGINVSCDPAHKFLYSTIEGNICSENIRAGIYLYRLDQCIIKSNVCRENGVGGTWNGIIAIDTTKSLFQNNSCQDNTSYGIFESSGCDNNLISGNYLLGNTTGQLTKTGANTIVLNNYGYATDIDVSYENETVFYENEKVRIGVI